METTKFNNRVFGAVILKSINSNFNADFTHHPRTLPDGTVYSTDKALKYAIKDFIRKNNPEEKLLIVKRYNESLNPMALDESFSSIFNGKQISKTEKLELLSDLLSCIDVKLFGVTFAPKGKDIEKKSISIHGPVQINHGVNKYPENEIYTEDILSPFRNPGKEGADEKGMSTIGNQTNLKEGHYVFHFSINPKNTDEFYEMINKDKGDNEKLFLSSDDIAKLKKSLNNSVTALDSSRKIGTENEVTIWIQLNKDSKKVMPSLTELITVEKINGQVQINLDKVNKIIEQVNEDIEIVEVFFNPVTTVVSGLDKSDKIKFKNIINENEI